MICLEYILELHGVQHKELAEKLGIKKQNINRWVKNKQDISKKHLPELSRMFDLPEEIFQKELTEILKLYIQKSQLQHEMQPTAYQQQLCLQSENESGIIEVPIYDSKEMNEVEFKIKKAIVAHGFREVLEPITQDDELRAFQLLLTLFQEYGDERKLHDMIAAISHYFNVLPEWEKKPETNDFINEFMELVGKYYN